MHFAVKQECQGCWLWVGGRVEDRIPGAVALALEPRTRCANASSQPWCEQLGLVLGRRRWQKASSSEQLCCVVLEAQAQAGSLDTHHSLKDYHSCLDIFRVSFHMPTKAS